MTTPTGRVAFTVSLPVDVLMKSAPAIMATWLARATFTSVAKSPVPRITFMWASPQASRKARTSSRSEEHTSELQSRLHLVCRLLLEKKKRPAAPDHPRVNMEHDKQRD